MTLKEASRGWRSHRGSYGQEGLRGRSTVGNMALQPPIASESRAALRGWPSAQLPSISVVEDRVILPPRRSSRAPTCSAIRYPGTRLPTCCAPAAGGRPSRASPSSTSPLPRLSDCNTSAIWLTTCARARLGHLYASLYARARRPRPRAICETAPLAWGVAPTQDADVRRVLLAVFRRRWEEVMAMVNGIVFTARRSRAEEGVLAIRFPWPGEVGNAQEYGSLGMVVVDDDEFARPGDARDAGDCTVVCFAGQTGEKRALNLRREIIIDGPPLQLVAPHQEFRERVRESYYQAKVFEGFQIWSR
ncbi:hypothetical protein H4582DRAFT_2056514 [Lactarius indigo]|nr:hypothetical protein H4582DRAFT_2056514 [Lactarius indigo]